MAQKLTSTKFFSALSANTSESAATNKASMMSNYGIFLLTTFLRCPKYSIKCHTKLSIQFVARTRCLLFCVIFKSCEASYAWLSTHILRINGHCQCKLIMCVCASVQVNCVRCVNIKMVEWTVCSNFCHLDCEASVFVRASRSRMSLPYQSEISLKHSELPRIQVKQCLFQHWKHDTYQFSLSSCFPWDYACHINYSRTLENVGARHRAKVVFD